MSLVARVHLAVWSAELRQRVGGRGRLIALALVVVGAIVLTSWLSADLAPDVGTGESQVQATRAILAIVFALGGLVWIAFCLALPSNTAVDSLLWCTATSAPQQRSALAAITLLPAGVLATSASMALCAGMLRAAQSPLDALAVFATISMTVVTGMAVASLVVGSVGWLCARWLRASAATANGIAATVAVGLLGWALLRFMADSIAQPTLSRPLSAVGEVAGTLASHNARALGLCIPVFAVSGLAVLVGAAMSRGPRPRGRGAARWAFRWPVERSSMLSLELRQLLRFPPLLSLIVMWCLLASGSVAFAASRSATFAAVAYFGLASLLSASGIYAAGVNAHALWLFRSTRTTDRQARARLAAYLVIWAVALGTFTISLAVVAEGFALSDAASVAPIVVAELAAAIVIGACLPVSSEHGLAGIGTEFLALGSILLMAMAIPRIDFLTESTVAYYSIGVAFLVAGFTGYLLICRRRIRFEAAAPVGG